MWLRRRSWCREAGGSRSRPISRCSRSWRRRSAGARQSVRPAPWWTPAGALTRIRWGRPARRSARRSISRWVCRARSNTSPACARPRSSWRSTRTRTRRSSRWRITGSSVISLKSFPGSPKRSKRSMADGAGSGERFVPASYQPPLPLDRLIVKDGAAGAGDRTELDVLVVGAGPAGLACAIELAQLAKRDKTELNIGVLEKAEALGERSLSGAVVNPRAFRELFPELKDADFPFRAPVAKEAVYLLTAKGKWRL